jgi:hypothetical protein
MWFRRKWRGYWVLVMHATIRCRTFWLFVCFRKLKNYILHGYTFSYKALFECEIWSLILRENIDGGCLRIGCWEYLDQSGMEWRGGCGGWRKLHNKELHNLYSSPNITFKNSVALSPRANYTDWATAICWRNLVPTFADRGVSRGQRGGSPRSLISVF